MGEYGGPMISEAATLTDLRDFVLARILDDETAARRSESRAPARALAVTKAHRRVVKIAANCDPERRSELLRTLAATYAEHDEFRPEWRL